MSAPQALFVGGMPHSGTTITKYIISEHPDVVTFRAEFHLLTDPSGLLDLYRDLTEYWTRNNANQAIFHWRKFWRLFLHETHQPPNDHYTFRSDIVESFHDYAKEFEEKLHDHTEHAGRPGYPPGRDTLYFTPRWDRDELAQEIRWFVKSLYRDRWNGDSDYFCEDTPENLVRAGELKEVFPDAKFIHVHRHPFDTVTSLRGEMRNGEWRQGFPEGRDLETTSRMYRSSLEKWWETRKTLNEDDYIEISLSDWASRYGRTVQRVQNFIGLDDTGDMIESEFDAERAHIGRYKPDGFGPDLEGMNQEKLYPILRPIFEEYGYS